MAASKEMQGNPTAWLAGRLANMGWFGVDLVSWRLA